MNPADVPSCFQIHERHDERSGKTLITAIHKDGFTVKFFPFIGFSAKFAAATIPYGSIHTTFILDGRKIQVPAGTAHFLEHCLFSRDEAGGLFGRLSSLGASANAYTAYDHTLYYFHATDDFSDAFRIWLDSLFQPQLDEERIEAERSIILSELNQYRDDPETRCSQILMENLYSVHPIRLDMIGTADQIKSICSDDLKTVFNSWYRPERWTLTLAGDLEITSILKCLADRLEMDLHEKNQSAPRAVFPEEPPLPACKSKKVRMSSSTPLFMVGVKNHEKLLPALSGLELAKRACAAHIVLNTLLSPVSSLYDRLYQEGFINDSFDFQSVDGDGFSFISCGGESSQPEKAASVLQEGLIAAFQSGLDKAVFEAQKKAQAGHALSLFDSVGRAGLAQARCNLVGLDLFDYADIYGKMDEEQAIQMMECLHDEKYYTTAMIVPRRWMNHAT